jgi:transposase
MKPNFTEEEEEKLARRHYEEGRSVRQLAQDHECSTTPIVRILKKFEEKFTKGTVAIQKRESPKKSISRREEKRRRDLSKSAVNATIIRKSEIIVNGIIQVLDGLKYNIKNLEDIQSEQKEKSDTVIHDLEELLEMVEKYIKLDVDEKGKEKENLVKAIYKTIAEAGNFYVRDMLRIKAIGELREQFNTYMKFQVDIKAFTEVKAILDAFFYGCEVLTDEQYIKYRNKVTEIAPAVAGLFSAYEEGLEADATGDNNEQE